MPSELHFCRGLLALALILAGCGVDWADEPQPPTNSQSSASKQASEKAQAAGEPAHTHTNALINSSSPYLLQHAHNPVNWLPWGPEAFAKAQAENKPIFVSIGYSTCYWCHVMERESFENEQVAAVLNEHYVAIKVDREQRPDIDEQLMLATQLMTGRGGWPNSVWLTSDGRPWMAGTYFPREQFIEALNQLSDVWRTQAEAVQKQADSLSEAIRRASRVAAPVVDAEPDQQPLRRALGELTQLYDADQGGFGSQPKFPPHGGLRLLAFAASQGNAPAQEMLTQTLDAMWRGGIHDHVGGGFHRYSTDAAWLLPHFEKMLYDNAQLLRSYAEAYELTSDESYRQAALDIFAWLQREMTDPQGGFYSALDSESDAEEGRFYTWSIEELRQVLSPADADLFAQVYQFDVAGNFTEEATGERPGTNIPHLSPESVGSASATKLAELRTQLLVARQQRVYPHLDDKVLTGWNGLMIAGLAYAGRVLEEPEMTAAAQRSAHFALEQLRDPSGLLHSWRKGAASIPAYLDDYAYLIDGLLELHTSTGDAQWLEAAENLTQEMLQRFEDHQAGGFFFTSEQHEELLVRSKNLLGGGNLPVGNGVAIQDLLLLYRKTGKELYLQSARRGLNAFSSVMLQSPRQVEHLVLAAAEYHALQAEKTPATTTATADATHVAPALTAELFLSHATRAPGEKLQLAVRLAIGDEYHLYAADATGDAAVAVQPTRVRLRGPAILSGGELIAPPGEKGLDPILEQQISLLTGSVWFYLPIQVAADAPLDRVDLQLELSYQACDQNRCLEPQTVVLSAPLQIANQQASAARHPQVFSADKPLGRP